MTVAENPPEVSSGAELRLLVADEIGQVKALERGAQNATEIKQTAVWGGPPSQSEPIRCMAVCSQETPSGSGPALFATGKSNGQSELRNAETGDIVFRIEAASGAAEAADTQIIGMQFLRGGKDGSQRGHSLLTCTAGGLVRVHAQLEGGTDSRSDWKETSSWQVSANVHGVAVDEAGEKLAVACKGSQLSIWSIESRSSLYIAKGAKPNRIGLMDPAWNTAVVFLPNSNGKKAVVGTNSYKLMVYDMEFKRPRFAVAFREARITALAPEASGLRCWAADARGEVGCLDLTTQSMQQVLKGVGGSIRGLAIHPKHPLIATAGLDRYLRIHDLSTRKVVVRAYLKQQLTAVGFFLASDASENRVHSTVTTESVREGDNSAETEPAKQKKKRRKAVSLSGEEELEAEAETDKTAAHQITEEGPDPAGGERRSKKKRKHQSK